MAILRDYECAAHGTFESFEPRCPAGCPDRYVKLVFLKPVGTRSRGTRVMDQQLRGLADDYKLPDIKNDKDGSSVMESIKKGEDFSPRFVPLQHAAPGWSQRGEKPTATPAAPLLMGKPGENTIERYNKEFAPQVGELSKPKPMFVNRPNPAPPEIFK